MTGMAVSATRLLIHPVATTIRLRHDERMKAQRPFAELLTTVEMGEADRLTIAAGTPGIALMEKAGVAVADEAARLLRPEQGRVLMLCGPGNNGGDGFAAGRVLRERGCDVAMALLGSTAALKGDAAEACRRWNADVLPLTTIEPDGFDLVIDGLFGAGLARDLDGEARMTVESLNAWAARTGKPVVAIDVPSGVDGNTGAVRGVAVKASSSVTFFRLKPGHLLLPGRIHCGRLIVADIGIGETALNQIRPRLFENTPVLWRSHFPALAIDGHKYTRGHALVATGGPTTTGAGRLSARGALRIGTGLVTIASPREALAVNAAHLTAIMLLACDTPEDLTSILSDPRKTAFAIGPGYGVGEATRFMVATALTNSEHARATVLDADALTSFAGHGDELKRLIAAAPGPVVLTPHEGEFGRLFDASGALKLADASAADPLPSLDRARNAAGAIGAIIILKGPDTIVAHPDGRASIAANAPPWLATAGSGDVLTGFVAGLLAQNMPPFEAASAAVWLHGEAAARFGRGLIAEDISESLPGVLQALLD